MSYNILDGPEYNLAIVDTYLREKRSHREVGSQRSWGRRGSLIFKFL